MGGSALAPAQQHPPMPSSPSSQATRQGPSPQPLSPAPEMGQSERSSRQQGPDPHRPLRTGVWPLCTASQGPRSEAGRVGHPCPSLGAAMGSLAREVRQWWVALGHLGSGRGGWLAGAGKHGGALGWAGARVRQVTKTQVTGALLWARPSVCPPPRSHCCFSDLRGRNLRVPVAFLVATAAVKPTRQHRDVVLNLSVSSQPGEAACRYCSARCSPSSRAHRQVEKASILRSLRGRVGAAVRAPSSRTRTPPPSCVYPPPQPGSEDRVQGQEESGEPRTPTSNTSTLHGRAAQFLPVYTTEPPSEPLSQHGSRSLQGLQPHRGHKGPTRTPDGRRGR